MYTILLHKRLSKLDSTYQEFIECQDDYFLSLTIDGDSRRYSDDDYSAAMNEITNNTTTLRN